jgi:hypothetical protein
MSSKLNQVAALLQSAKDIIEAHEEAVFAAHADRHAVLENINACVDFMQSAIVTHMHLPPSPLPPSDISNKREREEQGRKKRRRRSTSPSVDLDLPTPSPPALTLRSQPFADVTPLVRTPSPPPCGQPRRRQTSSGRSTPITTRPASPAPPVKNWEDSLLSLQPVSRAWTEDGLELAADGLRPSRDGSVYREDLVALLSTPAEPEDVQVAGSDGALHVIMFNQKTDRSLVCRSYRVDLVHGQAE